MKAKFSNSICMSLNAQPSLDPMMAESPDPALLTFPKLLCTQQSQEPALREKGHAEAYTKETKRSYCTGVLIPNDSEVRIIYVVYLPESQPVFIFLNSLNDSYGYRCKEIRREIENLKMLEDIESLEIPLNDASRWLSQMWANVVVIHSIRRRENRKESDGCDEKSKSGW